MFRTEIQAMPDNPAKNRVGVTTGLWRVVFWDQGTGSAIEKNPRKNIHKENLTWEEAMDENEKLIESLK